jgi:tetratricopeptide (TPR) repeat protein
MAYPAAFRRSVVYRLLDGAPSLEDQHQRAMPCRDMTRSVGLPTPVMLLLGVKPTGFASIIALVLLAIATIAAPIPGQGLSPALAVSMGLASGSSLRLLSPSCQEAGSKIPAISQQLESLGSRPSGRDLNSLGAAFGGIHRPDCAIPLFHQAMRLDPSLWKVQYNLALALAGQGKDRQAAQRLRAILKDHPHFAAATLDLSKILIQQGRYTAAVYYLKKSLSDSPPTISSQSLQEQLAFADSGLQDYASAVRLLRALAIAKPDNTAYHFELANALAHEEEFAKAASEYRRTLKTDPSNDSARLSLAKCLLELNQVQPAVLVLIPYVTRNAHDPQGYELLGEAYRKIGNCPQAIPLLERAVKMDARSYDAHFNLGFCLARTDESGAAAAQLREAIRLKADDSAAVYELGLLLSKTDPRAAAEEFNELQRIKQQQANARATGAFNQQAGVLLKEGNPRGAADLYRRAVQLNPADARLHYNLALALLDLHEENKGQIELRRAIQLQPNLAEAYNRLGMELARSGQEVEAERQFSTALKLNPHFVEAENNLGVLDGKEGKYSQASALLEAATVDDPEYAEAYLNWGLVLASQHQYAPALEKILHALRLSPQNSIAKTALQMIERQEAAVSD